MKILVLGGDCRMKYAYEILKEEYDTESIGLLEGDGGRIEDADVLLFPVPTSRDNKTVNCPLTGTVLPLTDIKKAKENAIILTYGYDFERANQTDYSKLQKFCIENAVLTAEGAISYAVENTPFALYKSKILITGFGRVGKALASRLLSFRSDLTISARNEKDLSFAEISGIKTVKTEIVNSSAAQDYDIIFNTLDIPLFEDLTPFEKTYLFDLSSDGCLDYKKVTDGLKIKKLPGIPGKSASATAGKIIADTVKDIIRRESK